MCQRIKKSLTEQTARLCKYLIDNQLNTLRN